MMVSKIEWTPDDVIAAMIIIGCLILHGLGINSVVDTILLAGSGTYFGVTIKRKYKVKVR